MGSWPTVHLDQDAPTSFQIIFCTLKRALKASLSSDITAPRASLIVWSVSQRVHLLGSPSPLSNHPLCSELSSGALFCSSALSCFSCHLVCLPCFIWFSPSVTCHNTHLRSSTATVWDLLSTSHEWFNQIIFTPVCCGVKALYGRSNQLEKVPERWTCTKEEPI